MITYPQCVVVALHNQQAQRMRHTILSSVTWLAVHIFQYYLTNCMIFGGKKM
jgi:hypothetical protein